ncbi:hypothetical protein N1851_027011 [Merluccius polli]|uniref:Gypsy retrotransposon integrase-like protein 1 n=1 Tax=Merluccius polli TaxID=89951 RepID=A0AA47MAR1_MERPO|nr:hypothetical protein N1851_027011 [Merluccius polli]
MEGGGDGALPAAAPPAPVIAAGPCATFNIQPPESFDFSRPQEWDKWIRRFERFRLASNLNSSSEDNQVNTLIYCMGDEADDILRGLTLSADQRRTYQGVRDGLQGFFVVKKNVIYERAKFNMRNQREGESVDSFVTALYVLAEHCSYAMLHNELIRDRIVVGLQDKGLSERMQLDADLTLDKAIRMARQSEEVKRQQFSLRGDTRSEASDAKSVDRVFKSNFKSAKNKPQYADSQKQKPHSTQYSKDKGAQSQCQNCGNSPFHQKSDCPANDVKCHACGRRGHYKRVCKSKYVHEVEEDEDEEEIFLGSVTTEGDPWMVNIDIHESSVTFKIDTGADVTVLPYTVFLNTGPARGIGGGAVRHPWAPSRRCLNTYRDNPPMLRKATKPLLGPGRSPLDVVGVARLILRRGEKEEREDVYIAHHVHTALLGRAVSCRLGLVARLDSVTMETLKENYPKLCTGLGEMRKCLWTADMLSRAPVEREENPADKELFEDTNIYVDMVLENLPASADYLEELREQLRRDSVCARVMQLCAEGWLTHGSKEPALRLYSAEQAFLTVQDGVLLKGHRLVIPSTMRNDVLAKLHEGHQGVVKCRQRARQSVWWPGLSQQLNELVLNCRTCCKERQNHREPLIPSPYPGRPWELGAKFS